MFRSIQFRLNYNNLIERYNRGVLSIKKSEAINLTKESVTNWWTHSVFLNGYLVSITPFIIFDDCLEWYTNNMSGKSSFDDIECDCNCVKFK